MDENDQIIAGLKNDIQSLRDELAETNRGVIALYSEIEDANLQLQQQRNELKAKNDLLEATMVQLEEANREISKRERNAAIGQMVITYNHEINNPLFVIQGTLSLMQKFPPKDEEKLKEKIRIILDNCDRISRVLLRIREFDNLLPKKYLNSELLDLKLTKDLTT